MSDLEPMNAPRQLRQHPVTVPYAVVCVLIVLGDLLAK